MAAPIPYRCRGIGWRDDFVEARVLDLKQLFSDLIRFETER
jgi:hypothetical protein